MKVEIKDLPNSQKELVFEIPFEEFEKHREDELDKLLPKAKIAGFRAGKVPKEVARKQFAHQIRSQAIERLLNSSIMQTLSEHSLSPIIQPYVSDVKFEDGKPISFKAVVEVFPIINIENYKNFPFNKVEVEVSEGDMNDALSELQKANMTLAPVEDRDDLREGDTSIIDFVGKIDGVEFQGGSAKEFALKIGSGQFIPGFEDQMIGMKKGETRDVKVSFPENYGAKDLAGKEAVFTVTLHSIKADRLPEIDDDLATTVDPNSKDLADFKIRLQKGLQVDTNNIARNRAFEEILGKIVDANPFEVPFSFVKEHAERMAYERLNNFYRMGIDPTQIGINFEELAKENLNVAKSVVQKAMALSHIAQKEGIKVEDADLDKYYEELSIISGRPAADIKADIEKSKQAQAYKDEILGRKVYAFLEENNQPNISKMSKGEYEKSIIDRAAEEAKAEGASEDKPKAKKAAAKPKKAEAAEGEEKPAKKPAAKKSTKKASEDKGE